MNKQEYQENLQQLLAACKQMADAFTAWAQRVVPAMLKSVQPLVKELRRLGCLPPVKHVRHPKQRSRLRARVAGNDLFCVVARLKAP